MSTLKTFTKQPGETQDYDIDFSAYLDDLSDEGDAQDVVAATGITVDQTSLITSTDKHAVPGVAGGVVKVWLSGGTEGSNYKITATLTSADGRVKEGDITVKVRES
jgi:hypothetical protein